MAIKKSEDVIREIQEWVNDPFNHDFMFERPLTKLNEFASGRECKVGGFGITELTFLLVCIERGC